MWHHVGQRWYCMMCTSGSAISTEPVVFPSLSLICLQYFIPVRLDQLTGTVFKEQIHIGINIAHPMIGVRTCSTCQHSMFVQSTAGVCVTLCVLHKYTWRPPEEDGSISTGEKKKRWITTSWTVITLYSRQLSKVTLRRRLSLTHRNPPPRCIASFSSAKASWRMRKCHLRTLRTSHISCQENARRRIGGYSKVRSLTFKHVYIDISCIFWVVYLFWRDGFHRGNVTLMAPVTGQCHLLAPMCWNIRVGFASEIQL